MCKCLLRQLTPVSFCAAPLAVANLIFGFFSLLMALRAIGRRRECLLGTAGLFEFGKDKRLLTRGTLQGDIGHKTLL